MASIKIETGLKTYDIEDENGNIRGQISFNPSDVNFFSRAQETREKIEELVKEAGNDDEELTESKAVEKINDIDAKIKELVNKLFDDQSASRVVFGNQNCLNTLNGITFVERFLTAFVPIIQAEFKEENKKSMERISRYKNQVSK